MGGVHARWDRASERRVPGRSGPAAAAAALSSFDDTHQLVEPVSSVVLGETQRSHADDPLWAAKRPGTHSRQGSPVSEKLPGSHAVHDAPSAAGSVPGSHGPHSIRSSPADISPRGPVVNWRDGRVMVVVGRWWWWSGGWWGGGLHLSRLPALPTF